MGSNFALVKVFILAKSFQKLTSLFVPESTYASCSQFIDVITKNPIVFEYFYILTFGCLKSYLHRARNIGIGLNQENVNKNAGIGIEAWLC